MHGIISKRKGRANPARLALEYLAAIDRRRLILWCAFLWYLTMAAHHAGSDPALWRHSAGIAAIVGAILVLNAVPDGGSMRDLGFWRAFRLFLIPFCVASFSMFTAGHGFFLIFPADARENLLAGGVAALFCGSVWTARKLSARPTE